MEISLNQSKPNKQESAVRLLGANAAIALVAVTLMTVALLLVGHMMMTNLQTFAVGVVVDGTNLSGMTYSAAERKLTGRSDKLIGDGTIKLLYRGMEYTLKCSDLKMKAEVEATLDSAFKIGKSDSADSSQLEFSVEYSFDDEYLRSYIQWIADANDVAPVESSAKFNTENRRFEYTEGTDGFSLNIEKAVDELSEKLRKYDLSDYELTYIEQKHTTSVDELKENTVLISEFTSITTDNFNRNTNIKLMCQYLNGYCIGAGEVLSINELVGQRTTEKGFMAAPAIMDGKRTVDDIGGGICQVSGTLYNAALLANMRIVERLPHSWPSDYLQIGLDSTLDWNSQKDLKIQNMSGHAMYIVAYLKNSDLSGSNTLYVALYGEPLPEGLTIRVVSNIIETYNPDSDKVTYSSQYKSGTRHVVIKARTGYRTEAWRYFYYDGELIDKELVSRSYYAPIRGEVIVGTASSGGHSGGNDGDGDDSGETPPPSDEIPIPSPVPSDPGLPANN